jgi:hypothetical protein
MNHLWHANNFSFDRFILTYIYKVISMNQLDLMVIQVEKHVQ